MEDTDLASVKVGKLTLGRRLFVIAGPCVIESPRMCLEIAARVAEACCALDLPYIFKASFDKANRTSISSFRGPGLERGLDVLARVKKTVGVPILTDIHEPSQAAPVAEVADVLQIPAFLCRQTDLILAAARTGRAVNIKKGQFLAPWDVRPIIEKVTSAGNRNIILTERGSSFGYNALVVDMRSIPLLRASGFPVVIDATHAVQQPGGLGNATGGDRSMVPIIAAAAVAAGADGVFLEVHGDPARAKSDAANSLALTDVPALLKRLKAIHKAASQPKG
jgi:2-dehydro-3-deoxyphosphooctonate aldolase (KDO 8-P synthase)